MKKLLAIAALMLSSSVLANQFEGTWRTFNCVQYGSYYYDLEMKLTTGDFSHFGTIEESQVKYDEAGCRNDSEIDRRTNTFEYINLFPSNDGKFFNIDVKVNGRTVYDIIGKGRYRGVPHIFFGKGGPARSESRRPTKLDVNRRFGDSSFGR